MAFKHGSKAKVCANGTDLSAYCTSMTITNEADTAECSVMGNTSKAYVAGLKAATLELEGLFDPTAGGEDAILNAALGQDDSLWTYFPQGYANVGDTAYGINAVMSEYEIETPVDDVGVFSAEAGSKVGFERSFVQHEYKDETAAGQSTGINNGAATSAGGVGYLHVSSVTGTSVTVTIKAGTDGVTYGTTLCTFTAVTQAGAPAAQRVTCAGAVPQYIRAEWTGTFTHATFVATFGRY